MKPVVESVSFAGLRLDPRSRTATWRGAPLDLGDRSFDALAALTAQAPETVSKSDLAAAVWPGQEVSDETLSQRVSLLRKALKAAGETAPAVKAVHGRGYVLVAQSQPVVVPEPEAKEPEKSAVLAGARPRLLAGLGVLGGAAALALVWWPQDDVQVLVHPETGHIWMGRQTTGNGAYPVRAQIGERSVLINSVVAMSDLEQGGEGRRAFCALARDRSLMASAVPADLAKQLDAALQSRDCRAP